MNDNFILEQIKENETEVFLRLERDLYTIGRESDTAEIVIDNPAISREHAKLVHLGSIWMYKDLGSTNGSWINETHLQPDKWYLLRCSDLLQIADCIFKISPINSNGDILPISQGKYGFAKLLIVLRNDEFVAEYPVPEYGRALVIGGASSDLELEGDLFEKPSLVIERRGEDVVVYSVAKELPILVNEEEITSSTSLKDGDEIELSNYTMFFNDPEPPRIQTGNKNADTIQTVANLRDWSETIDIGINDPETNPMLLTKNFGNISNEEQNDASYAIELGALRERADRFNKQDDSLAKVEDKVFIFIGVGLLIVLLIIILFWFFS